MVFHAGSMGSLDGAGGAPRGYVTPGKYPEKA